MRPEELLLQHQGLEVRLRALTADSDRLKQRLEDDSGAEALAAQLEAARSLQAQAAERVRAAERQTDDHRSRLKERQKELMSGHIRQPSELTKLSAEVDHLRARLREEEEGELSLMVEAEDRGAQVDRLSRQLEDLTSQRSADEPGLRGEAERIAVTVQALEAERRTLWDQIPPDFQAAYRRVRVWPPVAEVEAGQCGGCRVALTANELQQLRRGGLINCQTCTRLLVAV